MCPFQDICAVDLHESSQKVDGNDQNRDCVQRETAER